MLEEELDVDAIISTLLESRFVSPETCIGISEQQIELLITEVTDIFMSQPVLLELEAPIKLCGKGFVELFSCRGYPWSVL